MKRDNFTFALAVIMIVIVAIGGISIYFINPYSYDADVLSFEVDSVGYSLDVSNPIEYNVLVLDNFGIPPVESLIICSDGSSYSEEVKALLEIRGFDDVEIKDPKNMLDAMIGDPYGRAILVPQGPFPAEIYSGVSSGPLIDWLTAGGSVYWFGYLPEDGYKVNDSIISADSYLSPLGLSKESFCTVPDSNLSLSDEFKLCFRSCNVMHGLRSDIGKTISYVSDSGFSAITAMQVANGNMVVLGGGQSGENLVDLSQIIASGITYNTKLIGYDSGIARNTMTNSISYLSVPSDMGNVSLYIYVGGYYTVYGERF